MRSSHHTSWLRLANEHRALAMLAVMYAGLSCFAPNFFSAQNTAAILKGAALNGVVAVGFTLVLILGQLDLSIGANVLLSGMLTIGLQPRFGWAGAVSAALASGAAIGLVNGFLVVRARINSFIVTLGVMTVVTGLMHLYSGGGSKFIDDFRVADALAAPLFRVLSPMAAITLALVLGAEFLLRYTRAGRNVFMVGGNPEAAWLAGLNRDAILLSGFVICGLTAAGGGSLFAASLASMTSSAVLGTRTLMTVLAAVIIGGASMTGGKGSVLKSYFAVLMLTALFNGIGCFGFGFEVQIFVNGAILAGVVLYEAYAEYRHGLLKGRRPGLMQEAESGAVFDAYGDSGAIEEYEMRSNQNGLALICVTMVALTAIVTQAVLYAVALDRPIAVTVNAPLEGCAGEGVSRAAAALAPSIDIYALRGTDGQPYVLPPSAPPAIPPRPADPSALPETDKGHWWDIEFAGWDVEKAPMPASPKDGPKGKHVVLLKAGDHPYWTAYVNGFTAIAEAYGMETKVFNSNWNMDLQAQQTDQAINEKPDMIIFAPVDATACTLLLRRINQAGIPCIASNTIPCDDAMKYCLSWTGPDDWGQFRMLARVFAAALDRQGGYAVVRHMPGSSPFFARTYAPITELREYAPGMTLLAMDTANLEAEGTMQLVSAWLSKFGGELKGLVLAGDGFSMTGTLEALREAGPRRRRHCRGG